MALVDESIAEATAPDDLEASIRAEGRGGTTQRPDRHAEDASGLDARHDGLRDACRLGEVDLSPTSSPSDGSQDEPDASILHASRVTSRTSP